MNFCNFIELIVLTLQTEVAVASSVADDTLKPTVGGAAKGDDVKGEGDARVAPEEMTSKDYYFDSYAHFGIHEVMS